MDVQTGQGVLFFRPRRAVEMISLVVADRSVLARLRSRHTWRQQEAALPHTVTGLLVKMCRRVARTPEGADC